MRNQRLVLGLASSTLALFAVACSQGAADDSGQDEGATVIEPNGTDNPGKLTVTASSAALEPTTFKVDNTDTPRQLGQLVEGLTVSSHSVTLETRGPTYSVRTSANAALTAGQTTTLTPGLVKVDARTMDRTLGLGKDTLDSYQIKVTNGSMAGTVAPIADGSKAMALFGSGYEVNFGIANVDGVALGALQGTQSVTLSGKDGRRIARVQAPASRDMPPASCGSSTPTEAYTVSITSGYANTRITLAPDETIEFGTSPRFDSTRYTIAGNTWARAVEVPLGQRGAGPQLTKLGRVDVDDVLINSTQPRVKGTYQIYAADAQGNRMGNALLGCSPSTKSGVDLMPGKYRVEVSYSTVEAGQKVDVHVLDVN